MTPKWRRYLRFWGVRVGEDVDSELAFHVEMRVRDYVNRGMGEQDARAAAEQRFGNRGFVRNRCVTIEQRRQRRMNRVQALDAFAQDIRYALRTLGRQKGWTAVALLTMALGIGASTAMFSTVNSLILNPLPYRDASGVVIVWRIEPKSSIMMPPSKDVVAAWTAQTRVFESVQEFGSSQMTLSGRGDAADVGIGTIQPGFIAFTGTRLIAGRSFLPEETLPGAAHVAILAENLWRERFGAAPDAVGQRVMLNEKPYTIIGVAPARLRLPMLGRTPTDVWLPEVRDSLHFGGMIVARLRPGIKIDAAEKELADVAAKNGLDSKDGTQTRGVRLARAGDLVGFRNSLFLLSGAVVLLLLVACANVAHLLLARGATRERELAIRTALGAGRWRLARQLLTESALLAAAGCVGGVIIGYGGVRVLSALRPASLNVLALTRLDARALGVALGMSILAGLAFGCTAALHAVRHTTSDALRGSSASGTGAPRSHALRSTLVVTEMALSAMLLVGAALLVRSVIKLQHVDVGFDTRNLYAMTMTLSRDRFPTAAERISFADRVVESARAIPGVVMVTTASATPPNIGGMMIAAMEVEGMPSAGAGTTMPMNIIPPGYFQSLGIRLEGRPFNAASVAANEVIVSRALATQYLPNESMIGKRLRFVSRNQKPDEGWMNVIGVAGDVPTQGLAAGRPEPFIYQPIDPAHASSRWVVAVRVRDGVDPTAALRRIVTSMDARLVPPPVTTVEADLARTISTQRFTMVLLAVFAALAVVLSAIGLYGVISYVVTQRTREIGIRVALGATPANVARTIVARGLALSVVGLAVGLTAAVWGTRLIKTALFEVTGTDAPSYALAAATLLIVSIAACTVPTRRAMRVDPVIAMRGE